MSTDTRRRRGDMITVFKILKRKVDYYPKVLKVVTENRTRGHDLKLAKTSLNTDVRKNFFFNRIVNEWNSLGCDVIASQTVECFKKHYDRCQSTYQRGSPKRT